jgi:hypothetical protein
MVDSRKESDGVAGPLVCHCRSNIYNARNRLASLEIIRIRRLRDEVAKLVAAQDATDVAEDLVAADSNESSYATVGLFGGRCERCYGRVRRSSDIAGVERS